jgi:acetyltransferase
MFPIDKIKIRYIIDNVSNGYLEPDKVQSLLDAAGIPCAKEVVVSTKENIIKSAKEIGFPIVMKVVGPVHKSDVGGVKLNIKDENTLTDTYETMMKIKDATGVLLQPMLSGIELFVGAKREENFGHIILCGLGGIFIEVLKDIQYNLVPITKEEAFEMLKSLKSYKIIEGVRGQEGINQDIFTDIIVRLSALLEIAPEIFEMDINPLLGKSDAVIAVDARIRVEK